MMITPLYPTFKKRIDESFDKLLMEQIDPWSMFNTGKPMRVKVHSGKLISYQGIGFEGSPEMVFWRRYVEPFMEEIVIREIEEAASLAADSKVNGNTLLNEVKQLLLARINTTYKRMAEIDRRLKGKGFPDRIPLRSTEAQFKNMNDFVELRVRAQQELWKRSKFEIWLKNNKFGAWVITTVLALIGAYAAIRGIG